MQNVLQKTSNYAYLSFPYSFVLFMIFGEVHFVKFVDGSIFQYSNVSHNVLGFLKPNYDDSMKVILMFKTIPSLFIIIPIENNTMAI